MIKFTVLGEPVAQGRPRATTINGHVRMYDPAKSKHYKDYVRLAATEHAPEKPIEGPIALWVKVYRPIPKSFSKRKKELANMGMFFPTTKPDADNYVKTIFDSLNGVIWKDDAQVVKLSVEKFYSDRPRIEVEVRELDERTP